jgi:hypothetical protein
MQRRTFLDASARHLAALGLGSLLLAEPALAALSPADGNGLPDITDGMLQLALRVQESADAGRRPFAIVDKHAALLGVWAAGGRLCGVSRALLGSTPGDHSVPGVGERTQEGRLTAFDRTTPAGRFESTPGRNRDGEAIVWLDYEAALAIHRLRPGAGHAERARRLATAGGADKRVSAGCVVVPGAFYDGVVAPVLGRQRGVVYVMPERAPRHEAWMALWRAVSARQFASAF